MAGNVHAESSVSSLQWGRPKFVPRSAKPAIGDRAGANQSRSTNVRDAHIVSAAWEQEESSGVQQTAGQHQSIVVERTAPRGRGGSSDTLAYDPFDEDDRLAQLPNSLSDDPFDEPEGETIPVPDADEMPVDDLEDAQEAVEGEIERRRSASDLLEEGMDEAFEPELPEIEPLDEDDYEEEGPLSDNPVDEDENLLPRDDEEDWRTPDFDLDENDELELTPEELQQRSEELQREREESEENCREELRQVASDTISTIDLSIRVEGNAGEDFPYECPVSQGSHQPRQWPQITYNWKASAICHKPLYFEQVQLERYGHSWGPFVQPVMSGAHFFGTLPILPYKMGIRTPTECVYTLGYYRPGSCAPYMIDPIPFTWRAALFETGAVTGISFAVP